MVASGLFQSSLEVLGFEEERFSMTTIDAPQIVSELRATLRTARTRPAQWRLDQIRAVLKLVNENEDDIYAALHSDLHKSNYESFLTEVDLPYLFTMTLISIYYTDKTTILLETNAVT